MGDPQLDAGASTDHRGRGAADEPVHQAQRLFARLTEGGVSDGDPRRPASVPAEEPAAPPPLPAIAGNRERTSEAAEALEIARAALAATDRLAAVIDLLYSQSEAISTDLAALRSATRRAVADANERLAALESGFLGEEGQLDESAGQAVARLRPTSERKRWAAEAD